MPILNFIKNIGPTEWVVIAVIFVIIFGGKIAAKLGRTSGETLREIKNIKKSFNEAISEDDKDKKEES